MANNVLANAPIAQPKKHATAPLAIVLIIILTVVLILLGERVFSDLNKAFNPEYGGCRLSSYHPAVLYESATPIYQSVNCQTADYRTNEIMLHSAFAIPILLGAIILYFFTHLRTTGQPYYRGLTWSGVVFAFWLLVHVVIELAAFLVVQQKTLGVYLVFIFLIIILTGLIVFLQRRKQLNEK
ncbi:MAG: hypothetical protein PHH01_03115 [Patescibacteria group bacterium]|nr:hypothetical protein [Patescibacteria group bacterium]MDD5567163.1 hypothetical protein [Patescibacteria group bacterium]